MELEYYKNNQIFYFTFEYYLPRDYLQKSDFFFFSFLYNFIKFLVEYIKLSMW